MLSALFVWPSGGQQIAAVSDAGPIVVRALPQGLDLERRLFEDSTGADSASPPADAPDLAGIAGRLPHDAVALVRDDRGATRSVAIGQSHHGWRLDSLSADAALFTRGGQRVRVELPAASEDQ